MSIVGPRPLLVRYLDRYNEEQHHRHDVRPGLTGYAQAHGRNAISWEDKFAMDVVLGLVIVFSNEDFTGSLWFNLFMFYSLFEDKSRSDEYEYIMVAG